VRHKFTTFTS